VVEALVFMVNGEPDPAGVLYYLFAGCAYLLAFNGASLELLEKEVQGQFAIAMRDAVAGATPPGPAA
jgi:hypothetical protein